MSEEAARALEETANAWQWGGWADALLPAPTGGMISLAYAQRVTDWLRARAEIERLLSPNVTRSDPTAPDQTGGDAPPSIADTCCGKCPGDTCYVDGVTGA